VYSFPKTAVISSGDELVDITVQPEAHQLRRSNTYALRSAMKNIGWNSEAYYLVDNKEMIKETLKIILNDHDVLILSGGVSKGKFDFIPQALEESGFKKLFHNVAQRPGKPFWFGASPD
jgi:molybdopterin molybdotransferase